MLNITILPMILALILDWILGDPDWFPHPVTGFGRLIRFIERRIRNPADDPGTQLRKGWVLLISLILAAGVPGLLLMLLTDGILRFVLMTLIFWMSLAMQTMAKEARLVADRLENGTLAEARTQVGRIVGRDTQNLSHQDIAKACIESVAESTSDGIIAPMFWGLLLGPAGAMVYKAINTLDSMVGYKSEKYLWFGRPSAKADDVVNFIPARITGLLAVFFSIAAGGSAEAFRIYQRDHAKHASPNSGHPEAAFAGALDIELAGPSIYDGEVLEKPYLNEGGRAAGVKDILKAVKLMQLTVKGFLVILFLITLITGGTVWTGLN